MSSDEYGMEEDDDFEMGSEEEEFDMDGAAEQIETAASASSSSASLKPRVFEVLDPLSIVKDQLDKIQRACSLTNLTSGQVRILLSQQRWDVERFL